MFALTMRFGRSCGVICLFVLIGVLAHTHGASGRQILQVDAPSEAPTVCPLNVTAFFAFPWILQQLKSSGQQSKCGGVLGGVNVILALHVRTSGTIYVTEDEGYSCINAIQSAVESRRVAGSLVEQCGISAGVLSDPSSHCEGNVSRAELELMFSPGELENFNKSCSGRLSSGSPCTLCTASVVNVFTRFQGNSSNGSDCFNAINVWAAGAVNEFGPLDPDTAQCLFNIGTSSSGNERPRTLGIVAGAGGALVLSLLVCGFIWYRWRRAQVRRKRADKQHATDLEHTSRQGNSSMVWYRMEEIKAATRNFHRDNIIGSGAYGNVFKGQLSDGSWVALKRFKNCSPAGDAEFFHEVDVVSSVRHRHLVGLKGCAVFSGTHGGHQRIIVLEFVPNGTLQDHLFGKKYPPLDWPTRRKIAIGTARGLDYLHNCVKPAILHRDVKPSNILLDEDMNARVADFGLAKFTPEGMTHLTTRAGGTVGYIAPEYALFGQLTEKSDVYSFGIVLLELLTGTKALTRGNSGNDSPVLINDRAWDTVKSGRIAELLDPKMGDTPHEGPCRFLLIAILCAHTQVNFRPSMNEALKLLENDHLPLPVIPDRPIPLTSSVDDIERSVGGSTNLSSKSGFQSYSSDSLSPSGSGFSSRQ